MWTATSLVCVAFSSAPLRPAVAVPRSRAAVAILQDDLKPRFSRGDDDGTKTSFSPDKPALQDAATRTTGTTASDSATSANQQLLDEIRSLQPEPAPERVEKAPIDLNGIQPAFLILGAVSYGAFSVLAWQFTASAGQYFAAHPMDDAFYVVARLSGVARYVVVAMGGLGAGVSCIAAVGQLALAVQVQLGIMNGELDPNKPRVDPYGGRKQGELYAPDALSRLSCPGSLDCRCHRPAPLRLACCPAHTTRDDPSIAWARREKMLGLMLGDKNAGQGKDML